MMMLRFIETVFNAVGMGDPSESYEITTLGFSAVIMILYNMIAWPWLLQRTIEHRPNMSHIYNEEDRAKALTN